MNKDELRDRIAKAWGGVGNSGKTGLVINEWEVAHVLVRWAELMSTFPCTIPECEACNYDHSLWWEWELSLAGPIRIRTQRIMQECGIPLPPGPWEDIPTNAVPTALN